MKKIILLIIVFFFCFIFNISASALENIEDDLIEKLFSELDSDITDVLEDFGISDFDFEKIYNISFESILSYYKDDFVSFFNNYLSLFSQILSLIIFGVLFSIVADEKKYKNVAVVIFVPIITVILVKDLNACLSSAVSLLRLNGVFMLTYVPIFAIAIAVAGSPTVALTYNTLVLSFAELISAVINYGFIDIVGCYLCLSVAFSLNSNVNYTRYVNATNRFATFVLGLISALFTSLLSVRGIFAASTDSVSAKGIKFAIGSLIPVIGSSISDAYSSLIGSIGIIKNSIAMLGIVIIVLINLPVVAEIVIFNITINILSFISELLECSEISNALKGFAGGIKILGLMVIFEVFIFLISTGVILTLRGI